MGSPRRGDSCTRTRPRRSLPRGRSRFALVRSRCSPNGLGAPQGYWRESARPRMTLETHDLPRWPYGETESSRVLELDPDLARGLGTDQTAQATRHALAQVASLRPGQWT